MHADHTSLFETQLAELRELSTQHAPPEIQSAILADLAAIAGTHIVERSLQVGQIAPGFVLPDMQGHHVALADLLHTGPVVITFYRGEWCPFCDLTLRAYQLTLPQITAYNATMLAISPQTLEWSQLSAQQKGLDFAVLSDTGNMVARQYGLVYAVADTMRAVWAQINSGSLPTYNTDESWELPLPGTFVVDRSGTVRLAFVDPDYTRRLDPAALLNCLRDLG